VSTTISINSKREKNIENKSRINERKITKTKDTPPRLIIILCAVFNLAYYTPIIVCKLTKSGLVIYSLL